MKKKTLLCIIVSALISIMCFAGCQDGKVVKSLTDLNVYKDLDMDKVNRIHVNWDPCDGDGKLVEYDITDKEDLRIIKSSLAGKDALTMIIHYEHDGGSLSTVKLCDSETELAVVPLGHIKDGVSWYEHSTSFVRNYVYACGERMDYFRGFFGLDELGNTDLDNAVKVKAFIQQGDNWQSPTYTTYEICEDENVGYIVENLSYRKAFITINELWDSTDLSYIEIYDNIGKHTTVMLNYGRYKILALGIYEFIKDYGITNGYLQK